MNISLNVELHFHEQEKVSVYLESNTSGDDETFGEVSLFAMFAIRMISNLGPVDVSDQLATLLTAAPNVICEMASGRVIGGVELVPYAGYPGRKRFLAQFGLDSRGPHFGFQVKGLGWLWTGLRYYGPVAVIALMRYLAIKRPDDGLFLKRLSKAAALVGHTQLGRTITLTNHYQLCTTIVSLACIAGE